MAIGRFVLVLCALLSIKATDAGPTECNVCAERDAATCTEKQEKQTCATDKNSLGTTHCGSATGRYRDKSGNEQEGFIRGCINCADKKAACFALGGALKAREVWTLLKCEIECCTGTNCNTQTPTLTPSAITVFTEGAGPTECNACAESDAATCSDNQRSQTCSSDPDSLGTTHCASAVGRYKDKSGEIKDGFIRGCVDCADKKAACYALGGALKARYEWTVQECEAVCCTGKNCNTQAPALTPGAITVFAPTAECNGCVERDAASCNSNQKTEYCAENERSLGTSHCASVAAKYRDESGTLQDGFVRGCINCADKKLACSSIGGYIKAKEGWSLEKCEIECCTGNNCNTQSPTVSDKAIPVFSPPAAGASLQCDSCVDEDGSPCANNKLQSQNCTTDRKSLGTTHCFSAKTRYQEKSPNIQTGFIRGCIDCADKKVACAAISGALREREDWKVIQCEIECCTGDNCDPTNPTLPALGTLPPPGSQNVKPTAARGGRQDQHALLGVLTTVFALCNILYNF